MFPVIADGCLDANHATSHRRVLNHHADDCCGGATPQILLDQWLARRLINWVPI
jgi:hypothetical protein